MLEATEVQFDSKGMSSSGWWSPHYLLPFVLFIGFWIFLMPEAGWRFEGDEFWEVAGEADVSGFSEGDV